MTFDIVFAPRSDSPDLTFVEVEDEQGHSVVYGEWVTRDDGFLALRVPA